MRVSRRLEIAARVEAAEPGPWKAEAGNDPGAWHVDSAGGHPVVPWHDYNGCDEEDAVFIAHARSDIPDLLAEVERLEIVVAREAPCPECGLTVEGYGAHLIREEMKP